MNFLKPILEDNLKKFFTCEGELKMDIVDGALCFKELFLKTDVINNLAEIKDSGLSINSSVFRHVRLVLPTSFKAVPFEFKVGEIDIEIDIAVADEPQEMITFVKTTQSTLKKEKVVGLTEKSMEDIIKTIITNCKVELGSVRLTVNTVKSQFLFEISNFMTGPTYPKSKKYLDFFYVEIERFPQKRVHF